MKPNIQFIKVINYTSILSPLQKQINRLLFVAFLLIIFLSYHSRLSAQTLRILEVSTKNYPQVSAKLFSLDENLKPYTNIGINDIIVRENGVVRTVDSLVCAKPAESIPPLSGVLSIDVSESMAANRGIAIARTAAYEWVQTKTPRPIGEEVAITTFSDNSIIETDFSEDTQTLLGKIDSIRLRGGTNFDIAFLDPETGALSLFKNALFNRKVVVFLTDGNGDGNADAIIAKAKELNVTIFCVSVNIFIPDVLKRVATETGGRFFDNITTENDIRDVYRIIRKMAQNQAECDLYWQSGGCLQGRKLELSIPKYNLKTEFDFSSPDTLLPRFRAIPNEYFVFDGVLPLQTARKTVEIRAERSEITIDSIKSNNPLFNIVSWVGASPPITLAKNQSLKFNVEFAPNDSAFSFATFTIYGSSCLGNEFYCVGGNPGVPPSNSALRVLHPSGGEELLANSKSYITWDGTFNGANLKIDFSSNNGVSWSNIRDDYNQNILNDWTIPDVESNSCLVKVVQYSNDFGRKILNINTNFSSVNDLDWSPDGNLIVMANEDSTVRIVSSINGKTIFEAKKHNSPVNNIVWSPDAVRFASGGADSLVRIWNYFTQSQIDSIPLKVGIVKDLDWSKDGKFIAVATTDSLVQIFNTIDYQLVQSYKIKAQINSLKFSHNSDMIAFAGVDREINVYSTKIWANKLHTFTGHNLPITSITWRGNDTQIASASDSPEFLIKIWDLPTKSEIRSYSNLHQSSINSLDWNTRTNNIASTGNDALINVWNPNDGKTIFSFKEHSWPHTIVKWSGDGSRIATGYLGKNIESQVFVYSISKFPLLQGVSARNFSIIKVEFDIKNITMTDTKVGQIKDETFKTLINYERTPLIILDSIKIINDIDNAFRFNNLDLPITFNKDNLPNLIFQFRPRKIGLHRAKVVFYTSLGSKEVDVVGNGFQSDIEIDNVDFGTLNLYEDEREQFIKFRNTSNRSILIDSFSIWGNNDLYQIENKKNVVLAEFSTDSIKVTFDPKRIGRHQTQLFAYFEADSSNNRMLANVVNPTLLVDSLFTLNTIICEDSLIKKVKVFNIGRGNLIIDNFEFLGIYKNDFSVIEQQNLPITINQFDSLDISVKFKPSSNNLEEVDLIITSNSVINKTDKIKFIGRKTNTEIIINEGNNILQFLDLDKNETKDLEISIENRGEISLDLSSYVGLIITNKFEVIDIQPLVLSPNTTAKAKIRFLGGDKGQVYSAELIFKDFCKNEIKLSLIANIKAEEASLVVLNFNPELTLKPCNLIDTIKINLLNNGKKRLDISDIILDNSNFSVIEKTINIFPESSYVLNVIVNKDFEGIATLQVNFKSNSYDSDNNGSKIYRYEIVRYFSNYTISKNEIILEFQGTNNPLPIDFIINNISRSELKLKQKSDISPIEFTGNLTLEKQSNSTITISYNGINTNQIINRDLILEDECGNQSIIKLSVVPSNRVNMKVNIESLETLTNQTIEVPIILENIDNFLNSNIEEIELEFEFNKTLLSPEINQNSQINYEIEDAKGIVTQRYNLKTLLNNSTQFPLNLPSLKFFTLWGNDSTTSLKLRNVISLKSDTYPITFESNIAEIKLIDLCNKGGTRLFFDSDDTLKFEVIYNQNNSNEIKIDYNLIEKANANLTIFDTSGKIYFHSELDYNFNSLALGLEALPNGLYFIRCKTLNNDLIRKIIISK